MFFLFFGFFSCAQGVDGDQFSADVSCYRLVLGSLRVDVSKRDLLHSKRDLLHNKTDLLHSNVSCYRLVLGFVTR